MFLELPIRVFPIVEGPLDSLWNRAVAGAAEVETSFSTKFSGCTETCLLCTTFCLLAFWATVDTTIARANKKSKSFLVIVFVFSLTSGYLLNCLCNIISVSWFLTVKV